MAMEAEVVATQIDRRTVPPDRRGVDDRRKRRERRKPGNRINKNAPRRSRLQTTAAWGVGVCLSAMLITIVGAQAAGVGLPIAPLAFEFAALAVAMILMALGSLEQRLTEIRLELMMLNGGRRETDDRRQSDERRNRDRRAA